MKASSDPEVMANLERAQESLAAAQALVRDLYPDFAASRAYYAAFYAASALLLSRNLTFRKHSGVVAAIHRHFVRDGLIEVQHGRDLNWLFELRSVGDYGGLLHVTTDEAQAAIDAATNFVLAAYRLIDLGNA